MIDETQAWEDIVGPEERQEPTTEEGIIFHLIETVDPKDTAKLDEIDALSMIYTGYFAPYEVSFKELHRIENRSLYDGRTGDGVFIFHDKDLVGREYRYKIKQYTRSLDAIDTILPKNVCTAQHFQMTGWENGETNFVIIDGMDTFLSPVLPNEKLARLHAAIQCIAFKKKTADRTN